MWDNIHDKYRAHMFGFLIPSVSYRKWIEAVYYDICWEWKGSENYILFPVPFYVASYSMLIAVAKFIKKDWKHCLAKDNHYGFPSSDGIVSTAESLHATYQDGENALWARKDQRKRTYTNRNKLNTGKLKNIKPLWGSKMNQLRDSWWGYRYLYACWACSLLCAYGGRGSNKCEQTHSTYITKNPHIVDYTMGLDKFVNEEICVRFNRNYVKVLNLLTQYPTNDDIQVWFIFNFIYF